MPSCTATNTYQAKITPFVTYTHTTVEDPINPLALWGMLGGALAVLDLLAAMLLVLTRPCCRSCEAKAKANAPGIDVKEVQGNELDDVVP